MYSRASAAVYFAAEAVPGFSKGQCLKVSASGGRICVEFCMHVNQWGEMGNKYLEQVQSSVNFSLEIISVLLLYIEQWKSSH